MSPCLRERVIESNLEPRPALNDAPGNDQIEAVAERMTTALT